MSQTDLNLPAEVENVLKFWFEELKPEQWWRSKEIDPIIAKRFSTLFEKVDNEVPEQWLKTGLGCLAAVIILDQFPRNLFRNQIRSFASDQKALDIANNAIDKNLDKSLSAVQNSFLYMPYQHSEDLEIQKRSLELYSALGDENNYKFAKQHYDIIKRFGRFPHRNAILGRTTTLEEQEFLDEGALFW